ncbi:helix-turn-helix domain-containing protein [Herbaspirillum sp. SJZ099]|uniref:helix-turn-helix domain-containing protein n=1 Tax=Herbaspirillum sp. SJZ099 TaxID=2572916 RepID=UPI0011A8C537|nr:helix-turn-helix transcriptional regulator [Herbaspirillum sp. SJZ099]TWC71720.1 transcriptional regulator [Herbaspirillum sp. SJZ099]
MNASTNVQMINGPDGKPAFVVLPYDEYVRLYQKEKNLIPNEVIGATVEGATPLRAWREHLKLTQAEVAQRLGISQPAYAKQENSETLRPATIAKIAAALGITSEQLDF